MNRVVHFEIPVDDLRRAADFYTTVFDWKIEKWPNGGDDYWVVMTADRESNDPGINGGLVLRNRDVDPATGSNAFVCTVQVDDYEAAEKRIFAAGGRAAEEKTIVGGVAWQGYYLDTEGNRFGLHQQFSSTDRS
ncbi:MAG: VOC family protein [Chitinispirillaceae bacterium]|nr:VOC family protein [Chitinispirillaceae bacterium]